MQAVITVPAYFDEMRRKATADAGDMAGLRVLDIVNEPTAAALAFGEALGYLVAGGGHPLTGRGRNSTSWSTTWAAARSTPPCCVLPRARCRPWPPTATFSLAATTGTSGWSTTRPSVSSRRIRLDPRQDPATLNRLYLDAMEAKHTLSARSRAVIQINYQGRFAEIAVTREQFEEMSADLLERTSYTSRQLLGVAGLEWKDVQRVLLVGGSTRMPMVARMLQGLSGIQPDRTVNPDEAVARGAALYAGHLLAARAGGPRSTFQVTNVNAHSLGVEGIDTDTLRKKNVVLIPRNTPLPARHTERFATKSEGQRSIAIKVLEGESSQPGDCIAIGRTVVRDLPAGLPKGWPVEVTFEYGDNGRLAVEALVPGTQHQARLELVREMGLSNEGLTRWKQPVGEAGGFNTFESAAQDVLHNPPPSPEASPSGVGSAIGWTSAKADAAHARRLSLPPTLAATRAADVPASPAAEQRWVSGPQPLTDFSPLPVGDGPGLRVQPSPIAIVETGPGAAAAEEPVLPLIKRTRPEKKRRIPKWLERLIGHAIALVLFAFVGYLMISHIRPDLFPRHIRRQRRTAEQKPADSAP